VHELNAAQERTVNRKGGGVPLIGVFKPRPQSIQIEMETQVAASTPHSFETAYANQIQDAVRSVLARVKHAYPRS
jgi:hypothetical protein